MMGAMDPADFGWNVLAVLAALGLRDIGLWLTGKWCDRRYRRRIRTEG